MGFLLYTIRCGLLGLMCLGPGCLALLLLRVTETCLSNVRSGSVDGLGSAQKSRRWEL